MADIGKETKDSPYVGLDGFVKLLLITARKSAAYLETKDNEDGRCELQYADLTICSAMGEISRLIRELSNPEIEAKLKRELHRALVSSFIIGKNGSTAEGVEIFAISKKQSKAGSQPRTKANGRDAFDGLAIDVAENLRKRNEKATSSEVWAGMIDRIQKNCASPNLEADEFGAKITLFCNVDGKERAPRIIKKTSFKTIFSKLKRALLT